MTEDACDAAPVDTPVSAKQARALTTELSPRSVAETVARLESLAEGRGMEVFAVIDHSGEAEKVGLELRER